MRYLIAIACFLLFFGLPLAGQELEVTDSVILSKLKSAKEEKAAYAAILLSQQALIEAKKNGLEKSTLAGLKQLSELYKENKNTVQAIRYGLEYLSRVEAENRQGNYEANLHLGDIYNYEAFYGAALSYYRRAMEFHPENELPLPLVLKIGTAYFENHQLDSAGYYFHKQWTIYEEKEDYEGQLKSLQKIAKVFELQGNCKNALQFHRNIEQLVYANADSSQYPIVHNNLGYQYHCLQDYKNAINHFELAANLCEGPCTLDKIAL